MLAHKQPRSLRHRGHIEWVGIVQDVLPLEGRKYAAAVDAVLVGFSNRLKTRVEVRAGFLGRGDSNCRRQKRIEGPMEILRGQLRVRAKVSDLSQRVDARIRTSRAEKDDALLRELLGYVYKGALNCRLGRLNLPAVKVRAVIGHCELDVVHCSGRIMARRRAQACGNAFAQRATRTKRLPGFTAAPPARQSGQIAGS